MRCASESAAANPGSPRSRSAGRGAAARGGAGDPGLPGLLPIGPSLATCIFRMFSFSRLVTMKSTASCTRRCCSSAMATPRYTLPRRRPRELRRTAPPPRRRVLGHRGPPFPAHAAAWRPRGATAPVLGTDVGNPCRARPASQPRLRLPRAPEGVSLIPRAYALRALLPFSLLSLLLSFSSLTSNYF